MVYVVDRITDRIFRSAGSYYVDFKDLTRKEIFKAKRKSRSLGYVGSITDINTLEVSIACDIKEIPLIAPIGYDKNGQMYNINADDAAKELVLALRPMKYIAITKTGGILDKKGKLISEIKIERDYERLVHDGVVRDGMLKKLDEAKDLLERMGTGYSLQVVSPENIILELFTHKGAGTKITLE